MKTYFKTKLTKLNQDVDRITKQLVQHAMSNDIKELQQCTVYLKSYKERLEEITKDAAEYLPISDIIELLNDKTMNVRDTSYAIKYNRKGITLSERDLLYKIDYSFKDMPIK